MLWGFYLRILNSLPAVIGGLVIASVGEDVVYNDHLQLEKRCYLDG